MSVEIACSALSAGRRLAVFYDGHHRMVEVHAVGISTAGNPVMRVYQTSGGSNRGGIPDWRLMRVDKANSFELTGEISEAPRSGYKTGDKAMRVIHCQI